MTKVHLRVSWPIIVHLVADRRIKTFGTNLALRMFIIDVGRSLCRTLNKVVSKLQWVHVLSMYIAKISPVFTGSEMIVIVLFFNVFYLLGSWLQQYAGTI